MITLINCTRAHRPPGRHHPDSPRSRRVRVRPPSVPAPRPPVGVPGGAAAPAPSARRRPSGRRAAPAGGRSGPRGVPRPRRHHPGPGAPLTALHGERPLRQPRLRPQQDQAGWGRRRTLRRAVPGQRQRHHRVVVAAAPRRHPRPARRPDRRTRTRAAPTAAPGAGGTSARARSGPASGGPPAGFCFPRRTGTAPPAGRARRRTRGRGWPLQALRQRVADGVAVGQHLAAAERRRDLGHAGRQQSPSLRPASATGRPAGRAAPWRPARRPR